MCVYISSRDGLIPPSEVFFSLLSVHLLSFLHYLLNFYIWTPVLQVCLPARHSENDKLYQYSIFIYFFNFNMYLRSK